MSRFAFAALLSAVVLTAVPAAARAQLTAAAPAEGATVTQGMPVTFSGAGAGGTGYAIVDVLMSRSSAVDAAGKLTNDHALSPPTAYLATDEWTATWTPRAVGALYWQARRLDCTTIPCVDRTSAPRRLIVVAHPDLIRPAPSLDRPAADARVTVGKAFALNATDRHASKLTYEIATSPQLAADGTFAQRVWTKTLDTLYGSTATYKPTAPGTYYWHAIRGACRFATDFAPGVAQLLDVDCASRRASAIRVLHAAFPTPKLKLAAAGLAYKSGPIDIELTCANAPCRVSVTGSFTGKGTGRLPKLRGTYTLTRPRFAFRTLRPTRGQQRRIAAAVNRRGRLKLLLRATSTDTNGQRAEAGKRITLRKPKPPKPRKPKSPEQRAAEQAVGLRVAEVYQLGEDRTEASCRRSGGRVQWTCSWETDAIEESWGQTCWYSGEADASRISGDWWDIRLYDIADSCYDI